VAIAVAAAPVSPGVPDGYVEMTVADVVPTPSMGGAVLLYDAVSGRYVAIFVGGTEAASIDSRRAKRSRQRPLTHDLLDTLVRELGGEIVKVHVDDLRDDVFIGAVFVKKGDRVLDVDARPSDAMALAIGNRVPIYVARRVLDKAGLSREELEQKHGIVPPTAPRRL
jgi:hypothetical protein